MQFHVLGLGPIGNLLSFHLRRALPRDNTITLIHKNASQAISAMAHGAIRIEHQGIVSVEQDFRHEVFEPPDSNGNTETIRSLFVTTKAHHTVSAVRRLLPRLSANTTIVLMHNGMGIYEQLVHDVFRNPEQRPHFVLSSNTHGVFRKDTASLFVHSGIGTLAFGIVPDPMQRDFEAGFEDQTLPIPERTPRLSDISMVKDDPSYDKYRSLRATVAALLLLQPLDVSWRPISEMQMEMRRKLVVNVVINSLTSLMGCRNGDIFTTSAAQRIMQRVCQEASDVFAAQIKTDSLAWRAGLASQGVDLENVPTERLPHALTRQSLVANVLSVAETTKGNISSMLADVRKGRPTEVEYINGYLLNLGSTYRVPMPATATLLNLIKMRSAIPIDQML